MKYVCTKLIRARHNVSNNLNCIESPENGVRYFVRLVVPYVEYLMWKIVVRNLRFVISIVMYI